MDPNESRPRTVASEDCRGLERSDSSSSLSLVLGGIDRCAIELGFSIELPTVCRRDHQVVERVHCGVLRVGMYTYITWNNRLHVADGPPFPTARGATGPARDFRLALLMLDDADLAVAISAPRWRKVPARESSCCVCESESSLVPSRRWPAVARNT